MGQCVDRCPRVAWLLGKAWVLAAAVLIVAASGASAAQPDLVAILRAIDEQSNFGDFDFSAVLTIITQDPEKGTEKFVVREFRRDRENKFLLLIQEPKARMGEGYLMDEENLWFYDPKAGSLPHLVKESFAGSDARNEDFTQSSLAKDYRPTRGDETGSPRQFRGVHHRPRGREQ